MRGLQTAYSSKDAQREIEIHVHISSKHTPHTYILPQTHTHTLSLSLSHAYRAGVVVALQRGRAQEVGAGLEAHLVERIHRRAHADAVEGADAALESLKEEE